MLFLVTGVDSDLAELPLDLFDFPHLAVQPRSFLLDLRELILFVRVIFVPVVYFEPAGIRFFAHNLFKSLAIAHKRELLHSIQCLVPLLVVLVLKKQVTR